MAGVIQYTEELFNTAACKHEKLTEPKLVSPLPRLSPRGHVRKAEDDGNPSKPKRFRAARKSMDEGEGFRPYKPPLPSPGEIFHENDFGSRHSKIKEQRLFEHGYSRCFEIFIN